MRVVVQFYGSIRAAAETPEEEIVVSTDETVQGVLEKLRAKHTGAFQGEVFEAGTSTLRSDCTLTVNGVILGHGDVSTAPLEADSVIALLPVFPGGG